MPLPRTPTMVLHQPCLNEIASSILNALKSTHNAHLPIRPFSFRVNTTPTRGGLRATRVLRASTRQTRAGPAAPAVRADSTRPTPLRPLAPPALLVLRTTPHVPRGNTRRLRLLLVVIAPRSAYTQVLVFSAIQDSSSARFSGFFSGQVPLDHGCKQLRQLSWRTVPRKYWPKFLHILPGGAFPFRVTFFS